MELIDRDELLKRIDIGRYSDGEWYSEGINHYDDGNVLAWMPLPTSYTRQKAMQRGVRNER